MRTLKLLLSVNPLSLLPAFFGYVRIPLEAVRLAMLLEDGYRRLAELCPKSEYCREAHEAARALTKFLRTGRMLQ